MMVKTSGGAKPILLKEKLPDWSRDGDWITYRDDKGWNPISPDGGTSKFLGKIETSYLAFSRDGKLLYGIQTDETEADLATRSSLAQATLKQKVIKELARTLNRHNIPDLFASGWPRTAKLCLFHQQVPHTLWMLHGYAASSRR